MYFISTTIGDLESFPGLNASVVAVLWILDRTIYLTSELCFHFPKNNREI